MAKLNCCCDSLIQDVHLTKGPSGKMGVNNLEKKTICQSFWPHYYETLRWQILVKKSENGKMQKLARKFEGVQISNSFQF